MYEQSIWRSLYVKLAIDFSQLTFSNKFLRATNQERLWDIEVWTNKNDEKLDQLRNNSIDWNRMKCFATTKKVAICDGNYDEKFVKLCWKSAICDENCDGKLSVTISFVTNVIVTDPSQFVTETRPSQFFVTEKLWRTFSVTIRLWRKVRHNFLRRNSTARGVQKDPKPKTRYPNR